MDRRQFLGMLGAQGTALTASALAIARALAAQAALPELKADFTIRIGQVSVELAPKAIVKTTGYNGMSPGPILRMREGKSVTVDVFNETGDPELVHWHGLHIPGGADGAMEEGTPVVPPHGGHRRYTFTATPSGTRWYHTHAKAGRNLKRGTYNGQFGFLYIEPKSEPGAYDQEVFLALREWDPYLSAGSEGEGDDALEVAYERFSINDKSLGHGEPVRVKARQRVLFRVLNASATMHRRIALTGHTFQVISMDGNALPAPHQTEALELGPAERIDAIVEMNRPGVWVFGAVNDHDRQAGMGIVIEYAGESGAPRWAAPYNAPWDYTAFGKPPAAVETAERIPLVFEKKFIGHRWMDAWTINGKSYPKTDPIRVSANRRYRLIFDNRSDEAHPVHLHRNTFELTKIAGVATSGVRKDVAVVQPKTQMEVDLLTPGTGASLFHCHQQMHMDNGFMTVMECA